MITSRLAIDHIGITVPDLDEAVSFFVEVLGFDLVLQGGPYDDFGYIWPGQRQSEKGDFRLAIVSHGGTHNVELLEYATRERPNDRPAPEPADPGGMHLALHVEDIHEAAAQLGAHDGVREIAPPQREDGGALDGIHWAYFLTSFGLVVELIQWDTGLPYEATTAARLAPPPWRRPTPGVGAV